MSGLHRDAARDLIPFSELVFDGELAIGEGLKKNGIAPDVTLSSSSRVGRIGVVMLVALSVQFIDYPQVPPTKHSFP